MAKTRVFGGVPRLTIAVITRAAYPWHGHGGLERHAYDLMRHLMSRDVCVTMISPPDKAHQPPVPAGHSDPSRVFDDPRFQRRTVRYLTFPFAGRRGTTVVDRSTAYPLFGYRAGSLAANLVARGEVDLVYGLGASALGYALARRRGAPAPFVFNPQGLEEFGATTPTGMTGPAWGGLKSVLYGPLREAVRTCARAADRVIATDRVLEPVVVRHLPVDVSRVRVIPNGIDVVACDRMARADEGRRVRTAHGIADDELVLLSVGRLEANKGFHLLARSLGELMRQMPGARWRWVLIGDGPYRAAIQHAVSAAELAGRALFAGRVAEADLHAWYEAATLFVHPTLYEGSSLVTLEAMAHRRAVVATTAGGLPDKVEQGQSGWLVPPGDVPALTHALAEAIAMPARLPAMGSRGRQIAETTFSWGRIADDFLALCRSLVPNAGQASALP